MNATKQETVDVIEPKDLMDYLTPRVKLGTRRKTVRQLRAHLRRAKRLYSGGTRAESESLRVVSNETKTKCRQAFLRRQGRKIDLAAILSIVDSDGEPVWSVVCPLAPVSRINGGVTRSGSTVSYTVPSLLGFHAEKNPHETWGHAWTIDNYRDEIKVRSNSSWDEASYLLPSETIPPLPKRARALVNDPKIQRRAKKILLLSEATWTEHKLVVDPAIVVEWHDCPGEYYALAVWGGDYHRIMEFVS